MPFLYLSLDKHFTLFRRKLEKIPDQINDAGCHKAQAMNREVTINKTAYEAADVRA